MELYKEILCQILKTDGYEILLPKQEKTISEIIELKCYQALCEIKKILEDDTLDDKDCFERIEKIVVIFEGLGSGVAYRHDFG